MRDLLRRRAEQFADELTQTVSSVFGECAPFVVLFVGDETAPGKVSIAQAESEGIPLNVQGKPALTLKVNYKCHLGSPSRYLTVDTSAFHVFAGGVAAGEPLFRYEYVRSEGAWPPSAHFHLHAEREELADALDDRGVSGTRRSRRRGNVTKRIDRLHFPLGGVRFRPCLEDILQTLIREFGADSLPEAQEALAEGRARWRKIQTKSAVRDSPSDAVAELVSMGYAVTGPSETPVEGSPRLRQV